MRAIIGVLLFFVIQSCCGQNLTPCRASGNDRLINDNPPGCLICFTSYPGSTEGYSPDLGFDFPCGTIENNQWLTIYSDENGKIEIGIVPSTCDFSRGIEVGVYDADLNLVSDCFVVNLREAQQISVENLIAKTVYNLMIDGIGGDICDFIISKDPTPRPEEIKEIQQEPNLCRLEIGTEVLFTIDPVDFASSYQWDEPNIFQKLRGGNANDTFMLARMRPGGGYLKVSAVNGCFGYPKYEWISVHASATNSPPDSVVFICKNECFQIGDSCYYEKGFHTVVLDGIGKNGCDSLISFQLIEGGVPSPIVSCEPIANGILINWSTVSFAMEYVISINRDSIDTVLGNSYFIETNQFDSSLFIKIQPKGNCDFLPGEIHCNSSASNLNNYFVSNKISVFPNPTTGNLTIETDLKIEEIEILDTAGRILQKEKTISFELENREASIYFLKIKTSEGVAVKRILVN